MNDFDMPFDAKMLITIKSLKKFRDCIDEYIHSLEEAMKLRAKALRYEEKMKNDPFAFFEDNELNEIYHIGEQLQTAFDRAHEIQNKMNDIGNGIRNLF
ncbi:MAG: hypothetical protein J6Y02_12995 [Pseudobutyrivibrio sp.]|nr:hypothetical protein [Pseudobutyrivibrio sp.]